MSEPADAAPRGLLPGTVDLLILRTLSHGPLHGFGISKELRNRSEGFLDLQDAALYQALHRMERQGLVTSDWGLTENNRRARFYELTREGRKRLRAETSYWERYAAAVARVLAPAPEREG